MPAQEWRLIRTPARDPSYNLALDEALLRLAGARPTVRLYGWEPRAVSIGYFQRAADLAGARETGYPVVRRATGGGAVLHGEDITFAFVAPRALFDAEGTVKRSYGLVHRAVAAGLARLGVESAPGEAEAFGAKGDPPREAVCFRRGTDLDLCAAGRKIAGSAQRRTATAVLQHGSVPLRPNRLAPEAASVAEACGREVSFGEAASALAKGFEEAFGVALAEADPSAAEEGLARRLASERYGDPAWNGRR